MTILVTGATGQLGRETVLALEDGGIGHVGLGRAELDFGRPERIVEAVADYAADWVINCAAYTAVDRAEQERELAFTINCDAARAVAEGVRLSGGRLLHLSTDFVFDGRQSRPYDEDADTGPLGVYGHSKLAGERAVRDVLPAALILRTAWVYGAHGHNFVKTMLRLAAERPELRVVDDQIGTPSWTGDIVSAMLRLIEVEAAGTYHFTNEGVASWYDFAHEIIACARHAGMPVTAARVIPIPARDFSSPAQRPAYSVMSKAKIRKCLGYDIPHWRDSLRTLLAQPGSLALAAGGADGSNKK